MNRKNFNGFITGVILVAVGYVIGLFVGINIGGNYFTDFHFMSGVGYEATGYLGGIIGAIVGLLLGIFLYVKRSNKNKKI